MKPFFVNNEEMPSATSTASTTEMLFKDPLSVIDAFDHHEIVDVVEIDYDDIEDIMSEPVVSDFDVAFTTPDAALSGGVVEQLHEEEPIIPLAKNEDIFLLGNTEDVPKRRLSTSGSTVSSSSSGSSKRSPWKETILGENYELGTWDVVSQESYGAPAIRDVSPSAYEISHVLLSSISSLPLSFVVEERMHSIMLAIVDCDYLLLTIFKITPRDRATRRRK